ncbi:MAG: hypothetical protein CMJ91_08960 [Planctomycetes bacterium]|nr:hypothetical protein [Planctomycetota bacterium]
MSPRALTAILLSAAFLAPGADLFAQGRGKPARPAQVHVNSARWNKIEPARRREIEKIYEQIRALPADKQKLLLDKLRRMKPEDRRTAIRVAKTRLSMAPHEHELRKKHMEILRRSWNRLPPEEQKRLREMTPEGREKYLHKRFMAQRDRTVSTLPETLRKQVLVMTPPEQADFLRKHKAKVTSERLFNPQEITKLRSLDHKELRRLFHSQRKDSPTLPEKPDFLSAASWKKWNALKPYERPRVVGFILGKDRRRPPPGPGGRKPPPGGRGGEGGRGRPEQMSREETLKRFDKNADGKLDEAERKAAREQFQQERESSGNGAGQRQPRPEGQKPPRRPALRRSSVPPRTGPQGKSGQRPPGAGNGRPPGQQPRPDRARPGTRPAPGRKKR